MASNMLFATGKKLFTVIAGEKEPRVDFYFLSGYLGGLSQRRCFSVHQGDAFQSIDAAVAAASERIGSETVWSTAPLRNSSLPVEH
jgi:hypothetical protein